MPECTGLEIRGVTLGLRRAGRGPKVPFLHGAGSVPRWLPFFDALAERCELWVPEHPGFGGSDDPPWIEPRRAGSGCICDPVHTSPTALS